MRKFISLSIIFLLFLLALSGCFPRKPPGVITGEGFLSKTLFYRAPMKGTHITQGELDSSPGPDVGIFGCKSLHIVDSESGILKSKVRFKRYVERPAIVDAKGDGRFTMMVWGSRFKDFKGESRDVSLLDQDENIVWASILRYSGHAWRMAAGDLDRNGELEFYVATTKGLLKFNRSGKKIWQRGGWMSDVEVLDPGKDKEPLVITLFKPRQEFLPTYRRIQFWDYRGNLIRDVKPEVRIRDVKPCQWPTPWHILTRDEYNIYILNLDGKVVFRHKLNGYTRVGPSVILGIRGTTVRFSIDQEPYLAVLARFRATSNRSMLCLFSPNGELVYKELLPHTSGFAAIKLPSSKGELLLVGDCWGRVWSYRLNQKSKK